MLKELLFRQMATPQLLILAKAISLKKGVSLQFLQQGEPIEVSGKIGFRQVPIGKIEIQEVENDYSTGKLTLTKQDTKIEKGDESKRQYFLKL